MSQKTYDLRRVLESALILSLDTPKISPMHECYYLIPTPWLDAWSSFINSQSSVPPPRLNLSYFLNVDGHLKQGLSPIENYRAINSTQYHVFLYLYSTDSSPPQIRSSVDLYSPELSNKRIEEYVKSGSIRGRIEVNRLLIRVREGGGLGGAEKVEREVEEEEVWLWCITRDFIERVIECLFRCGRGAGVRYRKVKVNDEEEFREEEFEGYEDDYDDLEVEVKEEDIEMA